MKQEFVEDGIRYQENYNSVIVCGFEDKSNHLLPTAINLVIPSKVRDIPVKAIAPYAFIGDNRIRSITFSEDMDIIGQMAFLSCKNLKSVTITSVTKLTNKFTTPLIISNEAFGNCENLEVIGDKKMSRTVTMLSHAFKYCTHLTQVNMWIQEIHAFSFFKSGVKKLKFQPDAALKENCLLYSDIESITLHDACSLDTQVWDSIKSQNITIVCLATSNLTYLAYEGFKIEII